MEDGASTDPDITMLTSACIETDLTAAGAIDLLRPAPVSTCPSPASSEGGIYTSVSNSSQGKFHIGS